MAVAVRGGDVTGVILHTDQGGEYTAHTFRAACGRLGVKQSMGRPGSALDNAVIEAWHSTLTFELRALEHFATKAQTRARVAAWIDEYNRDRRHSVDYEPQVRTHRRARRDGRGVTATIPQNMAPSSPASTPRPTGGLRPTLTPAPGGTGQHPSRRSGGNINRPRCA